MRRWFRRRQPEPERLELRYGGFTGNPIHDTFWPECRRPLPHDHPIGTWDREGYHPPRLEPSTGPGHFDGDHEDCKHD